MSRVADLMQNQNQALLSQLNGRRILILGLGREGLSTYSFLRRALPEMPLALADRSSAEQLSAELRQQLANDKAVTLHSGPDYLAALADYDLIFKAPGIVPHLPELQAARARGCEISSNTRLFFQLCPGTIVGITGTKGKSTTTSVIYTVLAAGGGDVRLLGNIGIPPLNQLEGANEQTLFVAELSSHQLSDLGRSPQIAVLQNIVPEHLDYYDSFESYAQAKANITRFQSADDLFVYNAGYQIPRQIAATSKARTLPFALEGLEGDGVTLEGGWIVVRSGETLERIMPSDQVPLAGRFNLNNVLPAVAVGRSLGLTPELIADAIRGFRSLEHRLEFVATIDGVSYYNDSLATVPEAAIAALDAFGERPAVLIAGGYDRHIDYTPLADALHAKPPRALVLFPDTGDTILAMLKERGGQLPPHARVESMAQAVEQASAFAQAGDVVLLSPASASFKLFIDYRDRGEQFKAAVLGRATR